ncbi:MAG: alpha-galactosidase [Chloroflexota bacterium]|nr:alpha-galactosidase [Chloroflexota bacterium]
MAEAGSSGLGRSGPWLQNRWLRIETRTQDASLSPVALAGAFRPTERALAYAEFSHEAPVHFERADYDDQPYADELGKGRRLTLRSVLPRRGATLTREVVLYDAHPYCVTRVGVTNTRPQARAIDALHAVTTPAEGRGKLQFAGDPAGWRVYRQGWQSWSPTMSLGAAGTDLRSRPPELAPQPPLSQPGRFASDDVGVLFDPIAGRSMLAGAVTARDFVTQVFVDAPARAIDARCLTDGISIDPGETLWSERILIDLVGHPNEQLERYGYALATLMGARVPATTPAGWCSWYYFYTGVTEDDIVRNLRFLEQHHRDLPIDTVQVDDGYQADIGDWLVSNEKFPHGMAWLAAEIKRGGYRPGLWLAPLLIAESSRTFAAHPDWVVRGDDGAPVVATNNWQRQNFGLDGSHPQARDWLTDLFREVCESWGYDYLKIDFLFGGAIAGRRYDASATRVRAYRDALAAVRAGVGEQRFVLGCGSLMAPSVGVLDGNRIGPDVAPFWRNLTTAERAEPMPRERRPDDNLSVETAIRNTLQRSWMHGRMWANDPDCLLVRTDRTKLTLDETRTLASVIGLSAGMMLSSDDLANVPPERLDLISMLLPVLPVAATPVDLMEQDMPERLELAIDREWDPVRLVGLFNFADVARDLRLPLPPGRWHAFELWEERYRGVVEGQMEFALVAPHACRIVALRPGVDAPQVVGTTAHIGVGALDITHQDFDPASGLLRVGLAPAGRRIRRLYIEGGRRAAVDARLDAVEIPLSANGGPCVVEATVDAAATLEVRFA